MEQVERAIRRAGIISLVAFLLAAFAGYHLLPPFFPFPVELPERLAFAARASVFPMLCLLVAVGIVSTIRRYSPADVGGAAAGPPSPRLAPYVAFLQNTLEQAVLAVVLYFAYASLVTGPWLSAIVVAVVFFIVGRILFLRGYPQGAEGRALGMTLTMLPTIIGYLAVVILLAVRA